MAAAAAGDLRDGPGGGVGEIGSDDLFRDSAINNLSEFFERFKTLNVRSNEDLDITEIPIRAWQSFLFPAETRAPFESVIWSCSIASMAPTTR